MRNLLLHSPRSLPFVRTLCSVLLFLCTLPAAGQKVLHQEEHDQKPYYFGLTLGFNRAGFHSHLNASFLEQDSIQVAEPMYTGGFALGLLATTRLSNRFEFRFNPQLMFTERSISYTMLHEDRDYGKNVIKRVESTLVTFPFQLKFRSDRIGN